MSGLDATTTDLLENLNRSTVIARTNGLAASARISITSRKVPEAAPETRKAPAKTVDIAPTEVNKDGTLKKKKGRPKGSKNKPKLVETVAALTA